MTGEPNLAARQMSSRRAATAWLLMTAVLTSLLTAVSLRLWRMDAGVPLYADGDTPPELMLLRNIDRTGWFQTTSLLNVPFGQDLRAFPGMAADTVHLLTLKLLLLFSGPVNALNAYYLLTFPLVALSCHLALRRLLVRPATASFLSVLFALAPYHFEQNERHVFLSAYFMVPWACVVLLKTLRGELSVLTVHRVRAWVPGAAFVLLMASTGIYYAAFFLLLLGFAVLLRGVDGGGVHGLLSPLLMAAGVLGIIGIEALPNLLHATVGGGAQITGRAYAASERYGLKIDHLLLPSPFHRVQELGLPARRTFDSPAPGEGGDSLGLVGAVGFVLSTFAVLSHRFLGGRRLLRDCGRLSLAAVLIGTVAGLGGALSAIGFTYIRTWSRIAIFILFFALLAASVLWDHVCPWLAALGARGRLYRNVLIPTLFVLAVLDQTAPSYVPRYDANAKTWRSDAAYVAAVERAAGPAAAVFQLPFVEFPEGFSGDSRVSPYDGLLGYLHSDTLRWSFGGIRGENTQWQPEVLRAGLREALPQLHAVGFTAVQVDRLAYSDRGIAVEQVLRAAASQPPVEDSTARWATYLVDRVKVDPSLTRGDVLNPVQLLPSLAFESPLGAESLLKTTASATTFQLRNVDAQTRRVRLCGTAVLDLPGQVSLRTPDGPLVTRRESVTRFAVDALVSVPPGRTTVHLQATPFVLGDGPAPQVMRTTLRNLHVEAVSPGRCVLSPE